MIKFENDCRACQEELAFAGTTDHLPQGVADHLGRCPTCRSFAISVRDLAHLAQSERTEPNPDLVDQAMERLRPELEMRSREGIWLRARLAFAGLVSLPVILGLNGMLIWLIYRTFASWLSEPVGIGAASIVAASTLLGLSLAYGCLPLMAAWGLELRQRRLNLAWRPQ
jgi:predicted anti-sigma-YlaC factor YlaD